MKTLIIFSGISKQTFSLDGKVISKKQSDSLVFSAKKVTNGGAGWYKIKGYDTHGTKTRFFLEN